jgi:general secretion pathway protein A
MYTGFFGLTSQPFSIAPNPDFLFLSPRHAEALAHLRYGLGEAGGFVLLTGEVGTGKTTVSRCLLQELTDQTEVAFILNPTLNELELLAAICDQLKIRYKKSDASLKMLTDKITNRLMKNHQAGKNTILIIDEAQHLQPAVLEQLRLLTNLETNTKKLLQVILIGQPELQQLLQRQDLRQLAQRITARYHLMPLTEQEVQQYISYRLQVAGCSRPVFTASAVKKLFQLSGGIPRLLNLICDRALLGGYSQQKALIDAGLINQAASEVLAIKPQPEKAALPVWLWPVLTLVALGVGAGLSAFIW